MKTFSRKSTVLACFFGLFLAGCGGKSSWDDSGGNLAQHPSAELFGLKKGQTVELKNGLKVEQIEVGEGDEAREGFRVKVHYTGRLTDGTKFDSSLDRGEPIEVLVGAGNVIKGWDIGLQGMKTGGKRKLTIPPDLAYGDQDQGGVPPGSTLVFDVEMVRVD